MALSRSKRLRRCESCWRRTTRRTCDDCAQALTAAVSLQVLLGLPQALLEVLWREPALEIPRRLESQR
jgi:hypothetical protein